MFTALVFASLLSAFFKHWPLAPAPGLALGPLRSQGNLKADHSPCVPRESCC